MSQTTPLIVGNCSGFYGDRLSAAKEMVEGGPVHVITGDYLAELTMTILFQQKQKSPAKGYVGTFLKQMREVMEPCLQKGIKVVTNAGGLNPKAMAEALELLAGELNLNPRIAYIEGDDLMPRLEALQAEGETLTNMDKGVALADSDVMPVTANAYLGCWGIKAALDQGADIVVCPRVTDAAVIMGAAAWHFDWQRDDYDQLAGALAAGHIIECGTQATGGNYSFFEEVPSFDNMGFPIAEISQDGSFVITKHENTGGLVSVGTCTAQLLYEIGPPEYLNPDVTAHFDTLELIQEGNDRVLGRGCKGSNPPPSHKVCINTLAGHRNGMDLILTGLDIEKKAALVENTLFNALGGKEQFDEVSVQLVRSDKENPNTNEEAFAMLRINVKSKDPNLAGRRFSAKVIELALANYPGFAATSMPGSGRPYIVYWPALVDSRFIKEQVYVHDFQTEIEPTQVMGLEQVSVEKPQFESLPVPSGETVEVPLGRLFGTRSGDKGGCANLGVWAKTDEAHAFLRAELSVEKLKELLPDTAEFTIDRYELPNLKAINFFIHDILGNGVSSSTRMDGQAKTLGEYLRAKTISVPKSLMES